MVGTRVRRTGRVGGALVGAVVCAAMAVPASAGAPLDVAPAAARKAPASSLAVAFQGNALHDGHSVRGVAAPPLRKEWSRTFPGSVSYPIVAEGRVFVTAADPEVRYGTTLYALDQRTGRNAWRPFKLGGPYWWSALAYGDGRLFALNHAGDLRAFSARTGALLWTRRLAQHIYTSSPTFAGGRVFVMGEGEQTSLFAVDGRTGRVLWERKQEGSGHSSPAVTSTTAYVAHLCPHVYAFAVADGKRLWKRTSGCAAGGGRTPAVAAGGLWVRDTVGPHTVFDLKTGRTQRTFGSDQYTLAPAFSGASVFLVTRGVLSARPTARPNSKRWTFADRTIALPPLAVDGVVYALSRSGRLWAVSAGTGRAVWSTDTGVETTDAYEVDVSAPPRGLGAGQGHLLVPAGSVLLSYGR